jgi:hypothetical protein
MGLVALRRGLETLGLFRLQPAQTHQTGDSVLAASHALVVQLTVDARTAVDAMVLIVHDLDLLEQFLVRHLSRAGRSFAPGVVAAG